MKEPYAQVKGLHGAIIQLFLNDCIEGMDRLIQPGTVDVVVTSPPYNIGVRYGKYNDRRPRDDYLNWLSRAAQGVKRVLTDRGSFFLNIGSTPSDPWIPLDVARKVHETFILQNVFHWIKSIAISRNDMGHYSNVVDDLSIGHYKPVGGTRFVNDCHEYIFQFTKTGRVPLDRLAIGVPYRDKSNVGRWKSAGKDLRCRGNTWFIPYRTIWSRDKQRPHPSTFPERLPEMCIRLHGIARTRMALDPFIGLGSTAIAAYRLGVPCTGFDIDEAYLVEARSRLKALASVSEKPRRSREEDRSPKRVEASVPA